MDKKFIEDSFPVREVSEESLKEKNIRKGHISSLHPWWARRPLASSRATNFAALIPAAEDEIDWVKKRNLIIELSKWDNSLNYNLTETARLLLMEGNKGNVPKVLDPFSGGGAIPLESLRLGCETYANDYNPIAVLIEKCTLEYPQKYGWSDNQWKETPNVLHDDVKKWAMWVIEETKKEIGKFYPENNGLIPVSFFWARTLNCQNPSCELEIPLMKHFWLSKKKKIALKPFFIDNKLKFEIVGQEKPIPSNFDPSIGTISQAIVKCPLCNSSIDAKLTGKLFQEKKSGEKIVAIGYRKPKKRGKVYKIPTDEDIEIFNNAELYLENTLLKLNEIWEINPIPNEDLPPVGTLGFRIQRYGMKKWGDLFNSRQKLAIVTIIKNIHIAYDKLTQSGNKEYNNVIISYLALIVSKFATTSNNVCRWNDNSESFAGKPDQSPTLEMRWDYPESNPFSESTGSFTNHMNALLKVNVNYVHNTQPITITNTSATSLSFPNDYFDAVFTDPPYYDNIPYSYLSDFFYIWIKRALLKIFPELFVTPLTPKKEEIVAYSHNPGGFDEGKRFFEDMLKKSFQEIHRVLKPGGISTIVYAHKTTEGWETLINSLLDSKLVITASWPINTERKARMRAKSSAALASSIYIVARKMEKSDIGWFKNVKKEIETYIPHKLDRLWEEGISGADFFISAIGSAIEIFGSYEKILDNEGNEIRADRLLAYVRDVVSDYTVRQILHNGIADELSPLTKFYLMWRWNYGEARVPFDDARKLAQSAGIDLANEWNKGFILKRGEFITVQGPDKRDKTGLKDSNELVDVLHNICLLWKEGKQSEMKSTLKKSGYGEGEALFKVAQAISETLPNSSSEKKMIEGFLAGREKIVQDIQEDESQTKLV